MTPFLGVDITSDKNNDKINGEEFIVAKPSALMSDAMEKSIENIDNLQEKAKLPLPVRIVHWICGAVGFFFVMLLIEALPGGEITFLQMYQNAPYIYWVGGGCLAAWVIFTVLSRKKAKKVIESDEGEHNVSKLDMTAGNIYAELGVPGNAPFVDILLQSYKIKNGEIKATNRRFETTPYNNFVYKIYGDRENIYLADISGKYAFPRSELKEIRMVKKHITVPDWNKDTPCNKGEYKQYKAYVDQNGMVHIKAYYILELLHNGEAWGIYFPNYELPVFEEITGMKAE